MVWTSIAVRMELTRIKRPPIGRHRPLHPERCMSLFVIMGAKSGRRSLWVDKGGRIGLGERRDSAPKSIGHGESSAMVRLNGNEGTFVEVNGEPGGRGEVFKDPFMVRDVFRDSADDDNSAIGILKDMAKEIIHKRVKKNALTIDLQNHLLQDINNNVEKERG
jgi:hypothetical protein